MAIRPIIFSAPMVRALLAGRKTQTRRILKPQPVPFRSDGMLVDVRAFQVHGEPQPRVLIGNVLTKQKLPYGLGDLLYVREAGYFAPNRIAYAATNETLAAGERVEGFGRLRPSIHMPRWASRLTLSVTSVRVERLNDITRPDAIAEGCAGGHGSIPGYGYSATANEHFRWFWKRLHGEHSWDKNPWVVAVTFVVHRVNVDRMHLEFGASQPSDDLRGAALAGEP